MTVAVPRSTSTRHAVSPANISGYAKGINGVVIDFNNLPVGDAITPADFEFLRDEIARRTGLEWQPKTTQRNPASTV